MLTLTILGEELFDNDTNTFSYKDIVTVELEHSLVSLSKWESIYERPFLSKNEMTNEELLTYFKCMILSPNVSPDIVERFSDANIKEIQDYILSKQTATWFADAPGAPKSNEPITAELLYYWMTIFNVSFECQYWHLNRLFTLLRVCNLKAAKPKKMSRGEIAARNREINAKRRAEWGTTG